MSDKIELINEHIKLVLDNLYLHYKKLNSFFPYILVEGTTDTAFMDRCKKDDVTCISVSNIINGYNRLKKQPGISQASCKRVICNTVYGLSVIPAKVKCRPEAVNWKLYGAVDQDFDDYEDISITTRLFQTDSHDLETMLLSTDEEAVMRIKEIDITAEQMAKAECLAYEMSKLRQQIPKYSRIPTRLFKGESGIVEFSEITDGPDIDVKKALAYLNRRNGGRSSSSEIKKLLESIIKENGKNIDKNGIFKYGNSHFDPLFFPDFWYDVNGHDLLSALIYVNVNAYYKYYDSKAGELNREFEKDLIAAYEIKRFAKTRMFKRMLDFDLVEV